MVVDQSSLAYVSVEDTVRRIVDELKTATSDRIRLGLRTILWPYGGRVTVTVTDLPTDVSKITTAIYSALETPDENGHILFPVKEVEYGEGVIVVVGEQQRWHLLSPLPVKD